MAPNTTAKCNSKGTMSRPNRRPTGLDTDAADEHVENGEPEVVSSDSEVERRKKKKKKKKTKNELKSGERGEKPLPKRPLMRKICLMPPSQPSTPSTSAPRRQLRLLGPRQHPLFVPRDQ